MAKKCIVDSCKIRANFNFPGESKGIYCKTHACASMINVINRRCVVENCDKHPNFNFPGETKGVYCKIHSLPNMLDVKNKKCLYKNCNKQPAFNFQGHITPIYCKTHALDEMLDVKSKRCIQNNCGKRPTFNYTRKKALFCKDHALTDMVDVLNKKCVKEACNKRPNYNFQGETKALFCKEHALISMTDIISKRCIQSNCEKRPSFNYIGETARLYCASHKKPCMIDIAHCKFICKSCSLSFIKWKKDQELCSYCNPSKRQKTKENEIKQLLEKHQIKFANDKQITNDCCLKYRPDFLIDCNSFFLVLEVDEHAHESYPKDCETIRMNNISFALGLPVKFVRYNPDNKEFPKNHKHAELIKVLNELISKETLDNPETIYLFY